MTYKPPIKIPFQHVITGPVKSVADFDMVEVTATMPIYLPRDPTCNNPFTVCEKHIFYATSRIQGLAWKNDNIRQYELEALEREFTSHIIQHYPIKSEARLSLW